MASPNFSAGQLLPGFFGFIDYNAQGSGGENNRALLWGYKSSSGQQPPNLPFRPGSQQDADDGAGQGSDLARAYRAAVSQPGSDGADIWLMPISEPSGGVQSTYGLKVYVSNGAPAKAGTIALWIASVQAATFGFSTSDTATTIAAGLAASIAANADLPFASATASSGTITLTYRHKGTTGEDLPIRCAITPNATGVTLSPGQAVFSTTAVGAGTVRVSFGALSVSTAIAGGDTSAQIAAKVAASWNASAYPVTAVVDGIATSQVNFLFATSMDVRRMSASVITTTGTTVNLGTGTTDGTGSPTSLTYNGTVGTGAPDLTAALGGLDSSDGYRSWASPWLDSASVGSMATNIEASSDGSINGQKQQHLTLASFAPASVSGAVATAASPDLTGTPPHYAITWCPDVPIQGFELAARIATARAALWLSTPQKNWNGFQIKGNASAPILMPWQRPSRTAQNAALRTYGLAPVVQDSTGVLAIVKGRTTSLATDKRLWSWSAEAQSAFHVVDLALFYSSRFQGGSILRFSEPRAPGVYDKQSFIDATTERMRFWETAGNYDGAAALAPYVTGDIDAQNPNLVHVDYPESPVLDLDQVLFVGHFATPSS